MPPLIGHASQDNPTVLARPQGASGRSHCPQEVLPHICYMYNVVAHGSAMGCTDVFCKFLCVGV